MSTEATGQSTERAPRAGQARACRWAVVAGLAALLAALSIGCIAPAASSDETGSDGTAVDSDGGLPSALVLQSATSPSTTNPAVSTGPASTPDTTEPQPSPWKPNGTPVGNTSTSNPTNTPQPSPWHGYTPPPSGPGGPNGPSNTVSNGQ